MRIKTPEEIGRAIREKRKNLGLTQKQLAGLSRVGTRFIVELEAGKETASLGKTLKILNNLNLTLEIPDDK